MICLRLEEWMPLYRQICTDFGYDTRRDHESAIILAGILGEASMRSLEAVRGSIPPRVVICGDAETLSREIGQIEEGACIVAADGATSTLMDAGVLPTVIVTDLDGDVRDQLEANKRGSAVFVHAHGDNMTAVVEYCSSFAEPIVGTCQVPPPKGLVNFGGFTDGDRAACICTELGARTIRLAGFDLENPVPKPGKDISVKSRKLAWARRILRMLASEGVAIEQVVNPGR